MYSLLRRCCLLFAVLMPLAATAAPDPLPSWRDGAARRSILDFVARSSDPASPAFIPLMERVAVFEHDGTLWPERPVAAALRFAVDRVRARLVDHPEWYRREPYKTVIEADEAALARLGERELMQLLLATHGGISDEEFSQIVNQWLAGNRHPRFERPYTALVYQPMRELLALLEAHGWRSFIYASGGVEFLRSHVEAVYGVPKERVIGNQIKTDYQMRDGRPELLRAQRVHFSDERSGKAVTIQHYLGRRPRLIMGNDASDENMLSWTAAGEGSHLVLRLRHDDAEREYLAPPADSRARDGAGAAGWQNVSIKDDWKQLFSGEAPVALR